jgi:hypothetical protein
MLIATAPVGRWGIRRLARVVSLNARSLDPVHAVTTNAEGIRASGFTYAIWIISLIFVTCSIALATVASIWFQSPPFWLNDEYIGTMLKGEFSFKNSLATRCPLSNDSIRSKASESLL